jgi:hypothetical protein
MIAVTFLLVIAVSQPVHAGEPPGYDYASLQADIDPVVSDKIITAEGEAFAKAKYQNAKTCQSCHDGKTSGYDVSVIQPPGWAMIVKAYGILEKADNLKREGPLIYA